MAPTGWPSRAQPSIALVDAEPGWMSGMRVNIEPVASAWSRNTSRMVRRERPGEAYRHARGPRVHQRVDAVGAEPARA